MIVDPELEKILAKLPEGYTIERAAAAIKRGQAHREEVRKRRLHEYCKRHGKRPPDDEIDEPEAVEEDTTEEEDTVNDESTPEQTSAPSSAQAEETSPGKNWAMFAEVDVPDDQTHRYGPDLNSPWDATRAHVTVTQREKTPHELMELVRAGYDPRHHRAFKSLQAADLEVFIDQYDKTWRKI